VGARARGIRKTGVARAAAENRLPEAAWTVMVPRVEPIRYFHRARGAYETEKIYGESFLRWAYGRASGRAAMHALVKRPIFSRWYGRRMSTAGSRARIAPFIETYGLDPAEFAAPAESFGSFNEFFARRLRPEARPVDPDPATVVFPADGRHLGFPRAAAIESFFIKGQRFNLEAFLGDPALARRFGDGALVLSRLCPVDYHRFHFPAAGIPGAPRLINGPLFSVSPLALRLNLGYLWENKRVVTMLETPDLGTLLLVEIGATCVGTIQQTFTPGQAVAKGAEKGYFAFGGSSTITIFEPGRVELAADLLEHSANQTELYALMGTAMARRV
jgi:phosphatidylserine decarboxylase